MPRSIRSDVCVFVSILFASATLAAQTPNAVTAIRAGRLIDPDTGRVATNQVILVEGNKIKEVGANVAIPPGATIIDLSKMTVLPGLVDAHNHLALTYKPDPENNFYYLTYVMDSTALRAIQAVSNGIQMLDAGFTIVRDLGNNGNYADTALRQGIEQGWIPGPTIINRDEIGEEARLDGAARLVEIGDLVAVGRHRAQNLGRRDARQMPFCAMSLCRSSVSVLPCSMDQMPASIAFFAPFAVCTCPATFSPAFAASRITSRISSAV